MSKGLHSLPIKSIKIGRRFRRDPGDLESLQHSILHQGLLHPILVTPDNKLVCGWRRLLACKALKQEEILARIVDLDDLLSAERDENVERLPFQPVDALEIGRAIEERESIAARQRQHRAGKDAGRGRPLASAELAEANGQAGEAAQKAAEIVGMSRDSYRKGKAVLEAAEKDPDKFGDLVEKMNERKGRIDPAYREMRKRLDPPKHPHTDLVVRWLTMLNSLEGNIDHRMGGLAKLLAQRDLWDWSLVRTMILPTLDDTIQGLQQFREELSRASRSKKK